MWLANLGHDRPEVKVVRLRDDPVRIPRQCPTGDGSHEGLTLAHAAHEVRDQVREVRDHARHAAVRDRAQRQDTTLLS